MKRTLGLVSAFLVLLVGGAWFVEWREPLDRLSADPNAAIIPGAVASEPTIPSELAVMPKVAGPMPALDPSQLFVSRKAPVGPSEEVYERLWMPDLALDCQTYSSAGAGMVVMADWKTWTVDLFGPDGVFLRRIAWPGDGTDEVKQPHDVLCVGNCVYVCDTGNQRIQVYDLDDGSHEGTFTITALTGTVCEAPVCLSYTCDGAVMVETDQETTAVIRNGQLVNIVRSVQNVPNRKEQFQLVRDAKRAS